MDKKPHSSHARSQYCEVAIVPCDLFLSKNLQRFLPKQLEIVKSSCKFLANRVMASKLSKLHFSQSFSASIPSNPLSDKRFCSRLFIFPRKHIHESRRINVLSPTCSISSATPPTSKEEAITQAKISLSSTLEKPLNNPKLAGKMKKLKQPRFRVEIPVIDDSPSSLVQLAIQVFGDMSIKRKGSKISIVIFWSTESLKEAAAEAFESRGGRTVLVQSVDLSSFYDEENKRISSSADVAVFLAPEASDLAVIKTITDNLYPKPVVIFNPKWAYEEESDFAEFGGFLGSFEVVYSFMGLEVKGIFSKRKGVIFKGGKDGVLSGEKWSVLVEENGELKVVASFKTRPSITEVETVLYNLMAINSPITKSAKFLKGLVSNATGKKP